ncbi:MAG TPA: hypothetical protein VN088_01470 [Nocardioides sp.]|nr:hypothetical protein [Nocardioides sp.]
MGSPMRLRRAAVLAALACLLPALAACGASGTQVKAGDVVQARQAKQFEHGRLSTIATPIGTLKIRAGKAVTQLAAGDTHELTAQTAPSGLTYLPITWSYAKGTTGVYARYVGTNALPTVDVRSGDGTYRLPSPDPAQGAESFYVLVAASSEHPRLELSFDGVTQSADLVTGRRDTGRRARGLYRLSYRMPRATDCPDKPTWVETATAASTCKVTAPLLLPYAGGRWAKPGHAWLVVDVRTTLATYTQAGATALFSGGIYYPQGLSTTYRLGKRKPVSVLGANDDSDTCPLLRTGSCNSHAAVIFDANDKHATLTLLQRYKLTLGNGWGGYDGKKHETEVGTTVIPLPAPA